MTIKEYKEEFLKLADKMEKEHGPFWTVKINCTQEKISGTLDKTPVIRTTKEIDINF